MFSQGGMQGEKKSVIGVPNRTDIGYIGTSFYQHNSE